MRVFDNLCALGYIAFLLLLIGESLFHDDDLRRFLMVYVLGSFMSNDCYLIALIAM